MDPSAGITSFSLANFGLTTDPNAAVNSIDSSSAESIATCTAGKPPSPPSDRAHSTTWPLPLLYLNTWMSPDSVTATT